MFGLNPIMKQEFTDGNKLRVVKSSPFYTLQGEGPYAGHPAVFIRLHGCNLRCTFCDTQFSDAGDPEMEVGALLYHTRNIAKKAKLVVITGGEPLRQSIIPLCVALGDEGFEVQIETAGTLWIPGLSHYAKIVVSPKTHVIHERARENAVAFKYVINAQTEFEDGIPIAATQPGTRPRVLAAPREGCPVYLSPMDEYDLEKNKSNLDAVARAALKYGYIAGVQMHKIFEVD